MRNTTALLLTSVLALSSLACDKGEKKAEDKAADKAGDDKKADGDKAGDAKAGDDKAGDDKAGDTAGEIALPKIGLKADAPGGTNVSEMMGSDMVQGPNLVATVEKGDDKPKTGEEAQKEADMYTPENAKIETLDDGYVLTFTNKGGMGTNYWVQVRREIDGVAAWCTTTANSQEQSDAAVAFCKSLRK